MPELAAPPRFLIWRSVLVALWALSLVLLLIAIVHDLNVMNPQPVRPQPYNPYARSFGELPPAFEAQLFAESYGSAVANLWLSLWALAGAAGVAVLRTNPLGWFSGRRIIWGGMALAVLLGRSIAGWADIALGLLPGVIVFLVAPFLLLFAGMVIMVMIATTIGALFSVTIGVPVLVFNQLVEFENSLTVYRYQQNGLVSYFVRLGYWLAGQELPNPPDDTKGARFATPDEIAKLQDPAGMAFGHVDGHPLFIHTDKHVFIQASTRSGKGVTLIIPHLLRYGGSCFVLDPKGENARATGRRRAGLNDKVHYLDPFGISGKRQSRFNPLARFTPENMEAFSKMLAAALIIGERDHWIGGAQQLTALIILYVVTAPDIPPAKKDLATVRRLLLGGVPLVLKTLSGSTLADGLLASLALSFLQTPEKEFGSILSTAQRETEILDNPALIACLAAAGDAPEVDFADWHRGTMSVFVCLSAPRFPVFSRWLRIVLTAALDEMTDQLKPPPLPVCFMLDELATLGHLGIVENAVGLAAGYGIQLVTVWQDVAQMRDLYKGRWASFIGNAGVRAVFNLDDFDTAEYWSKFIGTHADATYSSQVDIYGLSRGGTKGEAVRPLVTTDELMFFYASDQMLVLPQGTRPIRAERIPYFRDDTLAGLWDDPRGATQADPPTALPPSAAPPSPKPPDRPPAGPAPTSPPVAPAPPRPAAVPVARAPVTASPVTTAPVDAASATAAPPPRPVERPSRTEPVAARPPLPAPSGGRPAAPAPSPPSIWSDLGRLIRKKDRQPEPPVFRRPLQQTFPTEPVLGSPRRMPPPAKATTPATRPKAGAAQLPDLATNWATASSQRPPAQTVPEERLATAEELAEIAALTRQVAELTAAKAGRQNQPGQNQANAKPPP